MNQIISLLFIGAFWLIVIGFIWQLTRMSLRERLHAMLGPGLLATGLFFIVGPIHFNKTVERSENEIRSQFAELLAKAEYSPAQTKLKTNELEWSLEALTGTARGMRKNNDAAAYTFFVCGILTLLSNPWKLRKADPDDADNPCNPPENPKNQLDD